MSPADLVRAVDWYHGQSCIRLVRAGSHNDPSWFYEQTVGSHPWRSEHYFESPSEAIFEAWIHNAEAAD